MSIVSSSNVMWKEACAIALTMLSDIGPARLSALLAENSPEQAWASLCEGNYSNIPLKKELLDKWRSEAHKIDPIDLLETHQSQGVGVWLSRGKHPELFDRYPYSPEVCFWQGDEKALSYPRVAIVGTRHCTAAGREIAFNFGWELAECGVSVVSGLALGIDGSAHRGALEAASGAPPIGVVGSGLDVIYPRQNAELWHDVREHGLLISEAPLGTRPQRWRFPARNRIIAILADVVVVIESHDNGGSLLTVDEADSRGIPVMAVPGPITSAASVGTNSLIVAGAIPACRVEDIMGLLPVESVVGKAASEGIEDAAPFDPKMATVLDAIGWEPTSVNDVLLRTGMDFAEVSTVLLQLESERWVAGSDGYWHRLKRQI